MGNMEKCGAVCAEFLSDDGSGDASEDASDDGGSDAPQDQDGCHSVSGGGCVSCNGPSNPRASSDPTQWCGRLDNMGNMEKCGAVCAEFLSDGGR